MKKRIKAEAPVQASRPVAGPYGPEYRSPQACEWMKGSELSYLKSGNDRALQIRDMQHANAEQSRVLKNQAEFQGGYTFDLDKKNRIINPNQ